MNQKLPKITLLIVVRNEKSYIEKSLNSLLWQSYPKELTEIIIIDGMSTDGTKKYLEKKVTELQKQNINIKILDNPKKILASGWNVGIKEATGDFICRIDAHSEICNEYIETGIREILKTDNEIICIGGILKNIGTNLFGKVVANLSFSKFGIGNSAFRTNIKKSTITDTSVFGIYKKWIFEKIGYFDESLDRNQDIALHKKIREQGYKFITHPEMKIKYYTRNTINQLVKKAFKDGFWLTRSGSYLRHKIPLFFVLYILTIPLILCLLNLPMIEYTYLAPLALYLCLAIYFSLKDGKSYIKLLLPIIFPIFHLSYGLGSLWGVLTNWKNKK